MPVIFQKSNTIETIAVWKIETDDLFETPQEKLSTGALREFQILRNKQKMACRKLVSIFAGNKLEIIYDSFGKPYLKEDKREISFSHSGDYAAMMLTGLFAGIDFELIRPKVLNIIHKFMNEAELESLSSENAVEHAHVYWGAKESLYKLYGKQQLIFKEQILIKPFTYTNSSGNFQAKLKAPGINKTFDLRYEKMFGYMLVHISNS